jgi:hypothetical protein
VIPAEQAVLGALLQRSDLLEPVFDLVGPEDFTGSHILLAQVMLDMWGAGRPIDPQTVLAEVMRRGLLERTGGGPYLLTLMERAYAPGTALGYAAEVQDAARRRQLAALLTELGQRVGNGNDTVDELLDDLAGRVDRLRLCGRDDEMPPQTADAFLAGDDTYDWVVPGLLEHGDRVLLTGGEGHGKSTLMRQVAVCLAAGLHPFTHHPIDPVRVLFVDCENGRAMSRRKFRPLVSLAAEHRHPVGDRLLIDIRPGGMDLAGRRDASWLLRRVTRYRPDVLITGSLYRLHAGNPNDEELARKISVALDAARTKVNCAVVLEAHAPHKETGAKFRAMRPAGSSLFLRWPEFGYGFRLVDDMSRPTYDLIPWRGPRDERAWPERLTYGPAGGWPWVEAAPASAWAAS